MSESEVIARILYPIPAALVAELAGVIGRYCERRGYGEAFIVTEGEHYRSDCMTVVAATHRSTT